MLVINLIFSWFDLNVVVFSKYYEMYALVTCRCFFPVDFRFVCANIFQMILIAIGSDFNSSLARQKNNSWGMRTFYYYD